MKSNAPKFYAIPSATITGIALNFVGMNPIRALYWSAVINGVVTVPLMVVLMIMSSNRAIEVAFPLAPHLRLVGWVARAVMLVAALALIISEVRGAVGAI